LRVTLASVGDALIAFDTSGNVTFLNPVAAQLTGWPEAEALGQPVRQIFRVINEQTRQPAEDIVARVLREKHAIELANHAVLLARDGGELPVEDSAAPILDASGQPIGVIIVFHDVTEKRRARQALRQSEQRYRLLFDKNPDGVFAMDPTGRFTLANAACEKISGYSPAELLQKTFLELCAPDQRAANLDRFQQSLAHPRYSELETALIHKDGTRVEVLIAGETMVSEGGALAVYCTAKDITRRKQAEEALGRLAAIVEWSDDAIISKTLDGIIQTWNAGAERLFGYQAGEVIGRPITVIIPPDRADEEKRILERLRQGEPVEHFETVRLAKDGRRLIVSLTHSPIKDSQGRVIGASKIVRDIADLVRAREVLTRSNEELERLVADRTAKLQELVSELEHFSYTITHDMRAPLRAMQGFAELLAEACAGCDRQDTQRFMEKIKNSAGRMDSLIVDALNYNRTVRQGLPLGPVDAGALLRGMLDTYPELQASRTQVEIKGPIPLVLANEAGLT
ncbi:MAG TPA: PAS domain S-box protein, partial [Geobacteraceae bacterium]